MNALVVVSSVSDWPLDVPGVQIVTARDYLTGAARCAPRRRAVYNLCRSYRYQSAGYYVSLLAAARGQRVLPSIDNIQGLKAAELVRVRCAHLGNDIQRALESVQASSFTLRVYFGETVAPNLGRLGRKLFRLLGAPVASVRFRRKRAGSWTLQGVVPMAAGQIPSSERSFAVRAASRFFASPHRERRASAAPRLALAVLVDPLEHDPPSDEQALARFVRAADRAGMRTTFVTRRDYSRVAEFDALFIRATTSANHYTYRFARRAREEGMAVVDDPDSILRCCNKVFLAESMHRASIPIPRTMVLHRENLRAAAERISLPCVLKQPDSCFSQGVIRVFEHEQVIRQAEALLSSSDLIIAQEYVPTAYDWRIGVFDNEPIWACKYYMAPKHWQIIKSMRGGGKRSGRVESVEVADAPREIIQLALRAASLIGDGLYGVDLKSTAHGPVVVEVNDNPSVDAGYEDALLKDRLYDALMAGLRRRVESSRPAALGCNPGAASASLPNVCPQPTLGYRG